MKEFFYKLLSCMQKLSFCKENMFYFEHLIFPKKLFDEIYIEKFFLNYKICGWKSEFIKKGNSFFTTFSFETSHNEKNLKNIFKFSSNFSFALSDLDLQKKKKFFHCYISMFTIFKILQNLFSLSPRKGFKLSFRKSPRILKIFLKK